MKLRGGPAVKPIAIENTGQINVVVLYQGFEKRDYWSYLVGQGEISEQ